jgi:hypothetical protein
VVALSASGLGVLGASGGAATTATTFTSNGSYPVPAGVCQVSIAAFGGGGGSGFPGVGGEGGAVQGDFQVVPGSSLAVSVGLAGGGDSSGGTGFNSGGDSGTPGEGSGGGSSAVMAGTTALVIAGGGGGGGGNEGAAGGAGGVGGLFSDGDGQNGLGAAGGAGGAGMGTPGDGETATLDGAGGAGADPGSAATDTPGGGGGGGSAWDTTALIGSTSDPGSHPGAETDGSVVITPAPVGQGCAPILQVMKDVSGTSTSGFTEHVVCTAPVETPTSVTAQATTTTADVSLAFKANGSPDPSSTPSGWAVVDGTWQLSDSALTGSTCTVTETATGGAASVSYACSWTPGASDHLVSVGCPGASSGPMATPSSVTFEGNGDLGILTVTNTFPAAQVVAIQPAFTG